MDRFQSTIGREIAQLYAQHQRVYRDVDTVLMRFRGLEPLITRALDGQGSVLCIKGVLPCTYQRDRATYNIPVAFYIPKEFPNLPPLCFVTPTATMNIRASNNVDPSGRVSSPYLQHWQAAYGQATFLDLLLSLQQLFGAQMPVYAKSSSSQSTTYGSSQPSPASQASPVNTPYTSSAYPPPSSQPNNNAGYTNAPFGANRPPQFAAVSPPYHPSVYPNQPAQPEPPKAKAAERQDYLKIEEEERQLESSIRLSSLQTAVTEKISRSLRDLAASLGAELEVAEDFGRRLLASQSEVQQGCLALESHQQNLAQYCDTLQTRSAELTEQSAKTAEAANAIQSGKRICQAANPVEEQLLRTRSEDSAIEDAAYSLQKGLEAGNVNLESCLKALRLLASEQFQKKALVAKISAILAASQ